MTAWSTMPAAGSSATRTKQSENGAIQTAIHYSLADKNLCFKLRERVGKTSRNVQGFQLRGMGLVDTTSGQVGYRASLQHVVAVGSPYAEGAGSSPLLLGAGVAMTTAARERPLLTVSARKHFGLTQGPNTVLSARADVDFDPRNSKGYQRGALRLHHLLPRHDASSIQALRLTVGVDLESTSFNNDLKADLYLQVRENNWAVHYQRKAVRLTYDL